MFNNKKTIFLDFIEIRHPEKFSSRNFPPDGSTFQQISLGHKLEETIPPYGYLNVQFFQQVTSKPLSLCVQVDSSQEGYIEELST